MESNGRIFAKAIYSGVVISFASIVNMSVDSRVAGAFLFSVALTSIFALGAYLYTGAVGNTIAEHKPGWAQFLALILAGNLAGTLVCGLLLPYVDFAQPVLEAATTSWMTKCAQSPVSAFLSACACGLLMYTAWGANRHAKERPVMTTLVIVLCVMTFVLARFDHSIANAFLLFASRAWNGASLLWLALMVAGNSVGAVIPAFVFRAP